MADVVLGIGFGHTPMLSEGPDLWPEHGEWDLQREGMAVRVSQYEAVARPHLNASTFAEKDQHFQRELAAVATAIEQAEVDALIVIGDDHDEFFDHKVGISPICIFTGESFSCQMPARYASRSRFSRSSAWAYYPPEGVEWHPGCTEVANGLVAQLVSLGIDVAYSREPADGRFIGHAFTFVNRRLLPGRFVRVVPVLLNTYFPPNQITILRCLEIGRALGEAVARLPDSLRIGIAASGGLSHPILDEDLDRDFIQVLQTGHWNDLHNFGEDRLQDGTSEIKNWIVAGRALAELGKRFELSSYTLAVRSAAMTGTGVAFGRWI